MDVERPEFLPDASADRTEMEALQRDIAEVAVFGDDVAFDLESLSDAESSAGESGSRDSPPVVAGVDQAFLDDRAVSAVVCWRNGTVVERASAVTPLEIPYVPGLLAFREGGPIVAALQELAVTPDVILFDGSGRIHYREVGLATHLGVVFDTPAVGVAKNLLCGSPDGETNGLAAGSRVPVLADEEMTAPNGTVVGYAVQTRQFESTDRYVNPVWVSPGHRVGAETAAALALATTRGYKLPEPIRLADTHADDVKADLGTE
jgi:deoxyribonuclease V